MLVLVKRACDRRLELRDVAVVGMQALVVQGTPMLRNVGPFVTGKF